MNINYDAQIAFALIIALIFAAMAGLIVALWYNKKILSFMQLGESPKDESEQDNVEPKQPASISSPIPFALNKQNKKAIWRYRLIIVFVGIILAFFIALFNLESATPDDPLTFRKTSQLVLAYAWPIIPSIGLLERWSSLKIIILSLAYTMTVVILIVLLNLGQAITLPGIMFWLFGEQIPLLTFIIILTSSKLRTLGPYFFIIFFLLVSASLIGYQILDNSLSENNLNSWIIDLAELTNSYTVFILFGIVPWLIAFFPLRYLARKVARLYDEKYFSEYSYLLIGVWLVVLLFQSLILSQGLNTVAYSLLISILILPLIFFSLRPFLKPKHQPPTLLLLRVFREDDGITKLFDNVLERWRFTGNTVMIGGKDLAIRTLEPDELFGFLNGKLQDRFISNSTHLQQEATKLDFDNDPDGRYRVNEFLCFDTTWKLALDTLITKTNLVLMDLRDYHAGRKGCSYELGIIANSSHIQKIIMLTNSKTDLNTAKTLLMGKANETTWIEDDHANDRDLEKKILQALLK